MNKSDSHVTLRELDPRAMSAKKIKEVSWAFAEMWASEH